MTTLQPPFALFVLSPDIDAEYISYGLRRAWRGNFMASWDLWVATANYSEMPKLSNPEGTVAPVRAGYTSPWVGKTLRECAAWLQKAPPDVALNRRYFTAMDECSKGEDTVLVCRVGQSAKTGDIEIDCFPQTPDEIALNMLTNNETSFDTKAKAYRRSMTGSIKAVRRSKTSSIR